MGLKAVTLDGVLVPVANGGTGVPSLVTSTIKRASEKALVSNLLINPSYPGPAAVTALSAAYSTTTTFFDPVTYAINYTFKSGNAVGTVGNGVQIYPLQNLVGAQAYGGIIEFNTDSPAVTLYVKRQSSSGYRLAINDQYVVPTVTAWSTLDGTFDWLAITGLPSGQNKIRLEMSGTNPVFMGTYLVPLYSMWPTELKIFGALVGDSYAAGSGATNSIDGFVNKLGILLGFDDLWPVGEPGIGYVAELNGTTFTVATLTSQSSVATLTSTSGLAVGQPILSNGTGDLTTYFPRHTYITNIVTNSTITLSNASASSASTVALFAANAGITPTDFFNGGTWPTTIQRLTYDVTKMPRVPDVWINALGLNDDANASGYQATILQTLQLQRSIAPQSLIIVLGVPSTPVAGGNSGTPNYISGYSQNNENNIASAVTAFNDPLTIFIKNSTNTVGGPGGSIFWGTGYATNLTTTGNTDLYIGSDGTHPTTAGHLFYAERFAELIRAALRTFP